MFVEGKGDETDAVAAELVAVDVADAVVAEVAVEATVEDAEAARGAGFTVLAAAAAGVGFAPLEASEGLGVGVVVGRGADMGVS